MRNALMTHAAWVKSRPFLIGITGLLGLAGLYGFRLGTPAGLSEREAERLAPIAEFVPNVIVARLPAVLVAIACVVLLYALTRRWHSRRVAVLSALLFASSGWMLHTGRSATILILYSLVPLALFAAGSWLATAKRSGRALLLMAVLYAVLLQIPGAVWFELASLPLLYPVWKRHLAAVRAYVVVLAGLIGLTGLAAVVGRLMLQPASITRWLGAHDGLPDSPLVFLDQWAHSVSFLFRGPEAPDLWLGHAPLLDAFSLVALLLGIIMYARHWRNLRVYMLLSFGLIASLLVGLSGTAGVSYLLPILYLIIGSGLTQLLHEWYVIFPRNPVARWIGTGVLTLAVLLAAGYHLTAYFVAWPQAAATQQAFTRPL